MVNKLHNYEKWNNYQIGHIRWLNELRHHPVRHVFVDYVLDNNIKSIVEIGPGELVEYQVIKNIIKDLKYTVIDVSDTFLDNCALYYHNIIRVKSAIEDIDPGNFAVSDLVYSNSVFEHSRSIEDALRNAISLATRFFFVFFKWSDSGDLTPNYKYKKKYWSTCFNIYMILNIIKKYAEISRLTIVKKNGVCIDFHNYEWHGTHRNGDYLVLSGSATSSSTSSPIKDGVPLHLPDELPYP